MAVHPSTRQHLEHHLGQAEFALTVAANFECLKGTPAHDRVREALAQVGQARTWVRETLAVEQAVMKPRHLPEGQGLPLTRKERLGHRWS